MPPPPTWVCFGSSPVQYRVVDGQKPSPSGEGGPAKPGRMRGRCATAVNYESDTLVVDPRHWGSPGSLQGGGRRKKRPPRGTDGGTAWKLPPAPKNQRPPLISQKSKIFASFPRGGSLFLVQATSYLALPLGELSPKVTERAVAIRKGPLRPVCALGTFPKGRGKAACQLSQRERQVGCVLFCCIRLGTYRRSSSVSPDSEPPSPRGKALVRWNLGCAVKNPRGRRGHAPALRKVKLLSCIESGDPQRRWSTTRVTGS